MLAAEPPWPLRVRKVAGVYSDGDGQIARPFVVTGGAGGLAIFGIQYSGARASTETRTKGVTPLDGE